MDAKFFEKISNTPGMVEEIKSVHLHEPFKNVVQRYYNSCKQDANFAFETLQKDLTWRKENKVFHLLHRTPEEILGCNPEQVAACFPQFLLNPRSQGKPILYYVAAYINPQRILKITTVDRYVEYQTWLRELSVARLDFQKSSPPYYNAVIDLQNAKMSQISSSFYSLIAKVTEVDQWHYPERVASVLIINAPMFFTMIWKVIKKFLHPTSVEKVVIVGCSNEKVRSALASMMPVECIPKQYGGQGMDIPLGSVPSSRLFCEESHSNPYYEGRCAASENSPKRNDSQETRTRRMGLSRKKQGPSTCNDVCSEELRGALEHQNTPDMKRGALKEAKVEDVSLLQSENDSNIVANAPTVVRHHASNQMENVTHTNQHELAGSSTPNEMNSIVCAHEPRESEQPQISNSHRYFQHENHSRLQPGKRLSPLLANKLSNVGNEVFAHQYGIEREKDLARKLEILLSHPNSCTELDRTKVLHSLTSWTKTETLMLREVHNLRSKRRTLERKLVEKQVASVSEKAIIEEGEEENDEEFRQIQMEQGHLREITNSYKAMSRANHERIQHLENVLQVLEDTCTPFSR